MKSKFVLIVLLFLASCSIPSILPKEIVNNFEGFGKNATGGSTPCIVTNLNNSGGGSFQDCLSSSGRYITFTVGGTIQMGSDYRVRSNTTIDGLSAPSPGITLTGRTLIMENGVSNIIIQGIRVRESGGDDAMRIYGGSHDIVVDHVSISGFGDGALDITESSHDITVSWSIFGDGQPDHKFPMLICYGAYNISVHHNLYWGGYDRNPNCSWDSSNSKTGVSCDIRNNLVWNYRYYGTRLDRYSYSNVVNNYYYSSWDSTRAISVIGGAETYTSGNFSKNGYDVDVGSHSEWYAEPIEIQSALQAAQLVLENAGARGSNFGLDSEDDGYIRQVDIGQVPPTSIPNTETPTATVTKTPTLTPTPTVTLTPTITLTATPAPKLCVEVTWNKGTEYAGLNLRESPSMYNNNTYESENPSGFVYKGLVFEPLSRVTNAEGDWAEFAPNWWVAMRLGDKVYAVEADCP